MRLGDNCSFSASTSLVTCTSTRDGLSITKTYSFKTAAGTVQQAPDSLTDLPVSVGSAGR